MKSLFVNLLPLLLFPLFLFAQQENPPKSQYRIKFPADVDQPGCTAVDIPGVVHENDSCGFLAVSVTDRRFDTGDACYKIFRTYRVIHWCEYDGYGDANVISRDEDCDGLPGDEMVTVIKRAYPDQQGRIVYIDRDTDPFNSSPAIDEGCDNPKGHWRSIHKNDYGCMDLDCYEPGFWEYTQVIKVYDEVGPTLTTLTEDLNFCSYANPTAGDKLCKGGVSIRVSATDDCSPDRVRIKGVSLDPFRTGFLIDLLNTSDGLYEDFKLTPLGNFTYEIKGSFPIGPHAFRVVATDGCGNTRTLIIPFEVEDCKGPSPICINGLTLPLMPADLDGDGAPVTGMATLTASSLLVGSLPDDCSGIVAVSIGRTDEQPDPDQVSIDFTCEDPVDETIPVRVYVWDGVGNFDYCETYIILTDERFRLCRDPLPPTISGRITTFTGQPMDGVTVTGLDSLTIVSTDSTGWYAIALPQPEWDYTLAPRKEDDPMAGISTHDVILIGKHAMGVAPLTSPYQILAADVDGSGEVTMDDVNRLRDLILGLTAGLPGMPVWQFVPAGYVFSDPNRPWEETWPHVIQVNDWSGDMDSLDFIGIKTGDVYIPGDPENRSEPARLVLEVDDRELVAGNTYAIHVIAPGIRMTDGYQLAMKADPALLQILDLRYGEARPEHFNLQRAGEGIILNSWNRDFLSSSPAPELFHMFVRARSNGWLSQAIKLDAGLMKAEAYDAQGEKLGVALEFKRPASSNTSFFLTQNQPNPFQEETAIDYVIPETIRQAFLQLSSASGQVIQTVELPERGQGRFVLKGKDLAAGTYYYSLFLDGEVVETLSLVRGR